MPNQGQKRLEAKVIIISQALTMLIILNTTIYCGQDSLDTQD